MVNIDNLFYKIMKYPKPINSDFFLLWKKTKHTDPINSKFSRTEKNKYMEKFINIINKHWKLYKSLPFVKDIYICNSLSFNAIKRDSDIDLFIITKKNSIRRARFFSAIYFKILWLKRGFKNKKQKFCLSFYLTEDNTNLYPLLIDNTDIYLTHRLGHLVPLYQELGYHDNIYKNNQRLKWVMPNHPQKHCINIWNNFFEWKTKSKILMEKIFGWYVWYIIENIISFIRIPILKNKIKKLGDKWKKIIVRNNILKFHDDIREKVSLIYKINLKK